MHKSLDQKLAAIHADPSGAKDFILADAKDADMAFGLGAPGLSPESHAGEVRMRSLAEYRQQIREIVEQGIVDIMLMSASTSQVLTIGERLFDNSHVTPAVRANDTSDIFVVRGGAYIQEPSRPFRTATLDHAQCGHIDCEPEERRRGANLGLYSITFNNRLDEDLAALAAYREFRTEAERKGFRHFLEVFDPNAPQGLSAEQIPGFVNDCIARALAGVGGGRPLFLKVVYHGPRAMEELVAYDPHLIVGILGGSAGTTYDAFKLIAEAQKYGARVALFGRKINNAECQLAFVEFLRLIVEGVISPEEAVRAYHGVLARLGIRPRRKLADDLMLETAVMSYGGSSVAMPAAKHTDGKKPQLKETAQKTGAGDKHDCGCGGPSPAECRCREKSSLAQQTEIAALTAEAKANLNGQPDFSKMSRAEKLAWNQARRDRIFG